MRIQNIQGIFFLVGTMAVFFSCSKIELPPEPEPPKPFVDKYENGFFLVNAGNAETRSTVHFVRYNTDSLFQDIYQQENNKNIDSASSWLFNAAINKDKIYLLTQGSGRILRLGNKKFNQEKASAFYSGRSWHSAVFISDDFGLLSGSDGLYQFNFAELAATNRLDSFANSNVRDIFKSDNYVFVLKDTSAKVLRTNDFAVIKSFDSVTTGFAKTADNKVWCAFGNTLISIDSKTLAASRITLKDSVAVNEQNPSMLTASSKYNYVFFATGNGGNKKNIFRFKTDSLASLDHPFITLPQGQQLSGAGLRYDKNIDALLVAASDKATKNNFVYIYDAYTGAIKQSYTYAGDHQAIMPVTR